MTHWILASIAILLLLCITNLTSFCIGSYMSYERGVEDGLSAAADTCQHTSSEHHITTGEIHF